jgi:hypothetical protein
MEAQKMKRAITWSYGGGTQSIAIWLLVELGKLPKPEWIGIADTSREATETWEYHYKYIEPRMNAMNIKLDVIPHNYATVDLYGGKTKSDVLLPAYTENGKLPTYCSNEWKKFLVQRRLRELGYGPKNPVITWIGMSIDEIGRIKESGIKWQEYAWPLALDMRMSRNDCHELILRVGLPEPPKSSCWMCPNRHNSQWKKLRDVYPDDWIKAIQLDQEIRDRDPLHALFLHKDRKPLGEINIDELDSKELPLFGQVDGCDSGFCFV